eukprot:TRINITY_DN646_c0_g1_i1.p1 TRINITY_DN646_c0_g1~~TRINITY_DN646_c0_g1_i1.p1  ORF type:complete len:134 (+),score=25.52 TRINITY_DN646_c0_g1_i1:130-531(+)
MIINEVGRSVFTQDFGASGISSVANLTVSGVTTMSDHLIIDDSTGAGTEYALNVKTTGNSRFGVLGNGAILLGNSSAAPFIATNDHHATPWALALAYRHVLGDCLAKAAHKMQHALPVMAYCWLCFLLAALLR